MGNQPTQPKKRSNPILWFLFAIVIPIMVAITLTIVIFSIAGVNVMEWAKKTGNEIPVIASLITTDEEKNVEQAGAKMQSAIKDKDEKIEQLIQKESDLEATIEQLEQKIAKLETKKTVQNTSGSNPDGDIPLEKNPVKRLASSYKEMDSEQAAKIIQKLEGDLAISLLKELPNDIRGNIFDEMDPEKAAELTQLFVESGN